MATRNRYRDNIVSTWRAAYDAWLLELEAASNGFDAEAADFKMDNPCPRLADFLREASYERKDSIMTTQLTVGPLGVGYDETSASSLAFVGRDAFAFAFTMARGVSDRVLEATSPFDFDAPDVWRRDYWLSLDGRSGFCIDNDDRLLFVFSLEPGRGDEIVSHAVRHGAKRLDCFDGYLPGLYSRHGFVEERREANWTPGEPDVVFMIHP
jgi:hypothetical protein